MTVVLVSMPFAALERPSLSLGLLSAILNQNNIPCETLHANLLFADCIGLHRHKRIDQFQFHTLGDWLFAHLVFPGKIADRGDFLRRDIEGNFLLSGQSPETVLNEIVAVRGQAGAFVDRLADSILCRNPKIVGCSSLFSQQLASLALLKCIREKRPDVVTMLGGANCEGRMGEAAHRHFPWVDYVVSGEADTIIAPLVREILDPTDGIAAGASMPGVFSPVHRHRGYPDIGARTDKGVGSAQLDSLPPPDFDEYFQLLHNLPALAPHVTPALPIETARGCWWAQYESCTFCGLTGRRSTFRAKQPETVVREMNFLSSRHGVTRFETCDNVLKTGFCETLFPLLRDAGAPYTIFYETRANLKRRQMQRLREAGVIWVQAGLESLDSRLLSLMKKGCAAWHNIRLLKLSRQFGIYVGWNLISGFPKEDDRWYADMAALIPLLHHLQPTASHTRLRFDRFSAYHEHPEQFGLDLIPLEHYRSIYDLPDEALADIAYFFQDRHHRNLMQHPILKILIEGSAGQMACRRAMREWCAIFNGDNPARLEYDDDGASLRITDTRICATAPTHELRGPERAAYLLMTDGIPDENIREQLLGEGFSAAAIAGALDSLLESRVAIFSDTVWLSLALEAPVPRLPGLDEFPGGFVAPVADDGQAASCADSPGEIR